MLLPILLPPLTVFLYSDLITSLVYSIIIIGKTHSIEAADDVVTCCNAYPGKINARETPGRYGNPGYGGPRHIKVMLTFDVINSDREWHLTF